MGGRVEFVKTPWTSFVLKVLELLFPIAPICRWIPPSDSDLEQISYQGIKEMRIYRFKPEANETVIFFIDYKPEAPVGGYYARTLFNVPQLDLHNFMRPPFSTEAREELDFVLRCGMVERFAPVPMADDAKASIARHEVERCRAMWEEFCKD